MLPLCISNAAREKGCSGWGEAPCVNTQVSSKLCMSGGLHCHCGLNYNGIHLITHTGEWYSTPSLHLKCCYKWSTWEVVCVEIRFNRVVSSDPHCCPAFTYCKNDMYIYVIMLNGWDRHINSGSRKLHSYTSCVLFHATALWEQCPSLCQQ